MPDSVLARMSVLAYEHYEHDQKSGIEKEGLTYACSINRNSTQAIVGYDDSHLIIAFRGTEPSQVSDWITDLRCACIRHEFGRVHAGFAGAFASIARDVRSIIREHADKRIICTGHSLGAALATVCAADVIKRSYHTLQSRQLLVTFGSPRVGNHSFASIVSRNVISRRYVNNNDVVPKCPYIGYWHISGLRYFNRLGRLIDNPPFAYVLYDGALGRALEVGRAGTAGILDHSMNRYYRLLKLHEGYDEKSLAAAVSSC